VLGASGFLGSHVTQQLVAAGRDVRIMVRKSSDTSTTDSLQLERCIGDVLDPDSLRAAMSGCRSVFHGAVDTRAWLRDPKPLYRVNVDGLVNSMEAALATGVERFVFTSSVVTIGRKASGVPSEADEFDGWEKAPEYIRCRLEAERRFTAYCRERGLPGVACCVGNTYGGGDIVPTPHGALVDNVAKQRMSVYWDGGGPGVGVTDAARALILAEQKGRVGERYIVAERYIDYRELFTLAAEAAGVEPPSRHMPTWMMYALNGVTGLLARLRGEETRANLESLRCARAVGDVDSSKARRELGWEPRPIEASIREAVDFYLGRDRT